MERARLDVEGTLHRSAFAEASGSSVECCVVGRVEGARDVRPAHGLARSEHDGKNDSPA
jgi:hypothetical protein